MSTLTVDSTTLSKLREVNGCVEIRDEAGELIGYFAPRVDRRVYETVEVPVSEEELRRRELKGGGRHLADILAGLETRA